MLKFHSGETSGGRSPWTQGFSPRHVRPRKISSATSKQCHEGLIVTCPGIADHPGYKKEALEEWRGGLAIEEEGYLAGLMGLKYDVPAMVLRGISDRAEGDKKNQKADPAKEEEQQMNASHAAAALLVKTINVLSSRW